MSVDRLSHLADAHLAITSATNNIIHNGFDYTKPTVRDISVRKQQF